MSFLFPLYLLGGLAVGLPILFHLIRQTPKGRQVFSSTMFLSPSPPRVTKRSRIEDWLLLLLRALAICLIAAAFARPFLRAQESRPDDGTTGTRYLLLIDTSASMRQEGYWENAWESISTFLNGVRPVDSLEVLSFDRETKVLVSLDEWTNTPPAVRASFVKERLHDLKPTWNATELGAALIEGAERLQEQTDDQFSSRVLAIVSDQQSGSRLLPLKSFSWPEDVKARFLSVVKEPRPNASFQAIREDSVESRLRLRVTNSQDAQSDTILIGWRDPLANNLSPDSLLNALRVTIPVGESRVVSAPEPPSEVATHELVLMGDETPFDNVHYVAARQKDEFDVLFHTDGKTSGADPGLLEFLKPMFPDSARRTVRVQRWSDVETLEAKDDVTFSIVGGMLAEDQRIWLSEWLVSGGHCLFVARDPDQSRQLFDLLGMETGSVSEAEIDDYQMLGQVDLAHPVLSIFDDPRYSDFTSVKIWKHRGFDPSLFSDSHVLIEFEDGSPALMEVPCGQGRLYLLATSWSRQDSELALWSKFIPIMNGLLSASARGKGGRRRITSGETVAHHEFDLGSGSLVWRRITLGPESGTQGQDASAHEIEVASLSPEESLTFDAPGIYEVAARIEDLGTDRCQRWAVNLDPEESRTEPLTDQDFESENVVLSEPPRQDGSEIAETGLSPRQLLNRELESKQQWWRWLLLTAIELLMLETVLAAFFTRRKSRSVSATPVAT
ncbi:MAG: BatA domain-containing protein [Planctomycetaceae bacterium]|nr:BatA domain-containing protein [Planctomycetaceae bacterium]